MSYSGIKDNEISKCLDDEEGSEDEDASDWEPESSKPSTKMSSKRKKNVGQPRKRIVKNGSFSKNHINEHGEIEGKRMKDSLTEQHENMKSRISHGFGSQNLSTNSDETKYDHGTKAASKKKNVMISPRWTKVKVKPMKLGEETINKIILRRNKQFDNHHSTSSSDSDSDSESKASERKNGYVNSLSRKILKGSNRNSNYRSRRVFNSLPLLNSSREKSDNKQNLSSLSHEKSASKPKFVRRTDIKHKKFKNRSISENMPGNRFLSSSSDEKSATKLKYVRRIDLAKNKKLKHHSNIKNYSGKYAHSSCLSDTESEETKYSRNTNCCSSMNCIQERKNDNNSDYPSSISSFISSSSDKEIECTPNSSDSENCAQTKTKNKPGCYSTLSQLEAFACSSTNECEMFTPSYFLQNQTNNKHDQTLSTNCYNSFENIAENKVLEMDSYDESYSYGLKSLNSKSDDQCSCFSDVSNTHTKSDRYYGSSPDLTEDSMDFPSGNFKLNLESLNPLSSNCSYSNALEITKVNDLSINTLNLTNRSKKVCKFPLTEGNSKETSDLLEADEAPTNNCNVRNEHNFISIAMQEDNCVLHSPNDGNIFCVSDPLGNVTKYNSKIVLKWPTSLGNVKENISQKVVFHIKNGYINSCKNINQVSDHCNTSGIDVSITERDKYYCSSPDFSDDNINFASKNLKIQLEPLSTQPSKNSSSSEENVVENGSQMMEKSGAFRGTHDSKYMKFKFDNGSLYGKDIPDTNIANIEYFSSTDYSQNSKYFSGNNVSITDTEKDKIYCSSPGLSDDKFISENSKTQLEPKCTISKSRRILNKTLESSVFNETSAIIHYEKIECDSTTTTREDRNGVFISDECETLFSSTSSDNGIVTPLMSENSDISRHSEIITENKTSTNIHNEENKCVITTKTREDRTGMFISDECETLFSSASLDSGIVTPLMSENSESNKHSEIITENKTSAIIQNEEDECNLLTTTREDRTECDLTTTARGDRIERDLFATTREDRTECDLTATIREDRTECDLTTTTREDKTGLFISNDSETFISPEPLDNNTVTPLVSENSDSSEPYELITENKSEKIDFIADFSHFNGSSLPNSNSFFCTHRVYGCDISNTNTKRACCTLPDDNVNFKTKFKPLNTQLSNLNENFAGNEDQIMSVHSAISNIHDSDDTKSALVRNSLSVKDYTNNTGIKNIKDCFSTDGLQIQMDSSKELFSSKEVCEMSKNMSNPREIPQFMADNNNSFTNISKRGNQDSITSVGRESSKFNDSVTFFSSDDEFKFDIDNIIENLSTSSNSSTNFFENIEENKNQKSEVHDELRNTNASANTDAACDHDSLDDIEAINSEVEIVGFCSSECLANGLAFSCDKVEINCLLSSAQSTNSGLFGRSERKRKALTEDSEATTSKVRHVSTHENVDEERTFFVSKNLAETKSTSSNDVYFQRNLRSPPISPAVKNLFSEKNSNKLNNCRTPTKLTEEDLSNKENKSLCSEQAKGDSTPQKIGTRRSLCFEEGYNSKSQAREKPTPLKQAQTPTKENKNSSRKQEQNTTPRKNEEDLRDLKESQILNELSPTKSRCENLSLYKRPTKSVSKTLNEESNETVTDTGTPTKTQTAELKRLNIDCNPSMINAASPVRQSRSSYNTRTPLKNNIGGENEVKSPKKISLKLKRCDSDNDCEDNSITKINERTETPSSSKKLNRASKLSSNEIEDKNSTSRTPEKSKIDREMKRLAIDCKPTIFAASPVRQRRTSGSRTATPQKSKISDSLKTPLKCSEELSDDAECVTPRGKDKVATMTPRSKALKFEHRNQNTMSPFARQSVTVTTPVSKKKSGRGFLTPSMAKKEHVRKEIKDDDLDTTRKQLHISTVPKSLPCRDAEFDQIKSFLLRKIEHSAGGCMYISGVPGTGKTATVHAVVRNLQQEADSGNLPDFDFVEVNGLRLTEPKQAYVRILQALTDRKLSPDQAQQVLNRRFSNNCKKSTIILVDELDYLCNRRQDVVYNILDWPTKRGSALVVLTISNTMDLPERTLKGRVTSRMGLTRVTFQPYSHHQLRTIVQDRLSGTDTFHPDAVQLVARKVAAVSGDARRALDICRRTTELVDSGEQVTVSHVERALTQIFSGPRVAVIQSLCREGQLVLRAIRDVNQRTGVDEASASQVYQHLLEICIVDGCPRPTVGSMLQMCVALVALGLIVAEKGRMDIMRKMSLNVSSDDIHYALDKVTV